MKEKKQKSNQNSKLKQLIQLDEKIEKAQSPSQIEEQHIEAEQRFESTYYSNKLEGNQLTKQEARKAIFSE